MEEEVVMLGKGSAQMEQDGRVSSNTNHLRPSAPQDEPDPTRVSLYKASLAAGCAFVTVVILPKFPISYITGKHAQVDGDGREREYRKRQTDTQVFMVSPLPQSQGSSSLHTCTNHFTSLPQPR